MIEVQSMRRVGCKKGYPYYAWGVYRMVRRRDGVRTWRLVRSGQWFRSDVNAKLAFEGIPIAKGIRHGTPVRLEHVSRGVRK